MRVAAVIPTFNEEGAIGRVIAALPRELLARVIVVDGGSTDATVAVARAAGAEVICEPRRGYGRACATGAAASDSDVIVFLDGDFSDYPDEVPLLLGPIARGDADLVIGSRLRGRRERGALPPHQHFGNWLAAHLLRRLFGLRVTDLGPFRAIRTTVLRDLAMEQMTYGWPVEMMAKAARRGYRVVEVPVSYRRRVGRSKISGTLRGSTLAAYYIIGTALRYARTR
jgi:glycosyltransferase involved in cell wall biosynthesis